MIIGNGIDFIEIDRVRSIHNKFKKILLINTFKMMKLKILSRGSWLTTLPLKRPFQNH